MNLSFKNSLQDSLQDHLILEKRFLIKGNERKKEPLSKNGSS